jgi:hypothetical protein
MAVRVGRLLCGNPMRAQPAACAGAGHQPRACHARPGSARLPHRRVSLAPGLSPSPGPRGPHLAHIGACHQRSACRRALVRGPHLARIGACHQRLVCRRVPARATPTSPRIGACHQRLVVAEPWSARPASRLHWRVSSALGCRRALAPAVRISPTPPRSLAPGLSPSHGPRGPHLADIGAYHQRPVPRPQVVEPAPRNAPPRTALHA